MCIKTGTWRIRIFYADPRPTSDPDRAIHVKMTHRYQLKSVFRFQIRTDPHKEMPPGSGSAWTDADPDPDPGGKKA